MEIKCELGMRLSDAERAVVEYINGKQCVIELLSISDVAEGAFVSNATVSRAVRKCGFSSFSEMKFRLVEDAKRNPQAYEMNRILSKSYTECMETIRRLDIDAVIEIAARLRRAGKVYILACGLTVPVAEEFAFQLQCRKIAVNVVSDSQLMRKMDLLAEPEDLVLILSVKNSTPELCIGAELAKGKGAGVVTICCTRGTALDKVSDLAVYGYTQSIYTNRMFGGTSRLGLMIITRTIAEYLWTEAEEPG